MLKALSEIRASQIGAIKLVQSRRVREARRYNHSSDSSLLQSTWCWRRRSQDSKHSLHPSHSNAKVFFIGVSLLDPSFSMIPLFHFLMSADQSSFG